MNGLYVKYIKRTLPLKQLALLLVIATFAITAGFVLYSYLSKDIQVFDNGKPMVVKTMGVDVEQALEKMNIMTSPGDYVSEPLNMVLDTDVLNVVKIKRAVPVTIEIGGQFKEIMTYRDTVEEVINDNKIAMGALDQLEGVSLDDAVKAGMNIKVVRVDEEILAEKEEIPFEVVEKPNNTMNDGETKIVEGGENGIKEKYYKITYKDGKPVNRSFVNEKIVKQAISQVVEFGTVLNFKNSRGETVRYSKILDMNATAYTASFVDTGKNPGDPGFGITYSGLRVREGIIAVDPKIIPLGTKVYVEVPGAAADYGFAIAADIGSAVKGKHVDLFFDSMSRVRNWGRKRVRVYILNEQNDSRWKNNDNPCQ